LAGVARLVLKHDCRSKHSASEIRTVSQLVIASNNAAPGYAAGTQVAHDLRNLLATVALHLETLQRLSGPSGTKAAGAAQVLLARGTALCNKALDCTANTDNRARRRGVDLFQVVRHVADLLLASAPKNFSLDICPDAGVSVFADPDELFRILFNLMSNAVVVANRKAGLLTSLALHVSREGSLVNVRLADNGPGLPVAVRRELFGAPWRRSAAPRHGYGLAIARELAERNGGTLTLVSAGKGTTFALKLPAFLSVVAPETPRWMGSRALAP
jgi:signal transduction histidine kinase